MSLVALLVGLLVFCLIWVIIDKLPIPSPMAEFKWVVYVVLALVFILWLLQWAGMVGPVLR